MYKFLADYVPKHVAKFAATAVSLFLLMGVAAASADQPAPYVLRISSENSPTHVQTLVIAEFGRRLEERSFHRIKVVHSHSGKLFRDREVVAALNAGWVDMAVPGMWQLDMFEPSVGVFMLPMFYGRERSFHYRLRDGKLGQMVGARLEEAIHVKVLGRWIDLGFANLFFSDARVIRHDELKGLRIRTPGGVANGARLKAFGAVPTVIPWLDLPRALSQKSVDGVLTTNETVRSGRLWDFGLKYSFQDREYFAQYVPIVSADFWNRLPSDLQAIVADSWDSIVDSGRESAAKAQDAAAASLKENGIVFVEPSQETLDTWRAQVSEGQEKLAVEMGIPEIILAKSIEETSRQK